MALIFDENRVPPRWAERSLPHPANQSGGTECINIAVIINMPDPALEDTEVQFLDLLDRSSGELPLHVRFYSLPEVPRGERAQQHLAKIYFDLEDLWINGCDALIVTGTEPRYPDLKQEPYWHSLIRVLDWAEENTHSTVLSCLAAHASVLHSDGIHRHLLQEKRFGLFRCAKAADHLLTQKAPAEIGFPHSRWNELRADELTARGYTVLTQSAEAGVDMFVKKRQRSLFLYFQGHPEYQTQTLLKEYRRDVKRFLRGERETYPLPPHDYFDSSAVEIVEKFERRARQQRSEALIPEFPIERLAHNLQNSWQSGATAIYRNWLRYVVAAKANQLAAAPGVESLCAGKA